MPVTPGSIPSSIPGTLLEKALTSSALARAGVGGALGAGAGALLADEDSRGTGALAGGALAALAALGLRPLAQRAVEGNWGGAGQLFSDRLLREFVDNGSTHAQMMAQRASPRWQHLGIRSVDGDDVYSYLTANKSKYHSHRNAKTAADESEETPSNWKRNLALAAGVGLGAAGLGFGTKYLLTKYQPQLAALTDAMREKRRARAVADAAVHPDVEAARQAYAKARAEYEAAHASWSDAQHARFTEWLREGPSRGPFPEGTPSPERPRNNTHATEFKILHDFLRNRPKPLITTVSTLAEPVLTPYLAGVAALPGAYIGYRGAKALTDDDKDT